MSLKANIQRNLGDFRSEYSKLPSDIIPAEMKTQVDAKVEQMEAQIKQIDSKLEMKP